MKPPTNLLRTVVVVALVVLLASAATGTAGAAETWTTGPAGATYETDSGLRVTPTVDHGAPQDPFNGSDTLVLSDATFTASGSASLNVSQFLGTRTNVSNINAASNAITVNPDDKDAVTVSGSVTELSFADVALDGTAQLTYSSSGSGTINVNGLQSNTPFAAVDSSGTVLSSGTTSASGDASISVDAATDESITLLVPDDPIIDNGAADPQGNEEITTRSVQLSVPVSDPDFADDGDELNVTFSLNGQPIDNQTITSNQTVTTTAEVTMGGENDWSVEVTDKYGRTTSSNTFAFLAPAQLTFREETAPDDLVTGVQVNITAYYGDETLRRNTSDGTINLTDFPTDQPITIRATGQNYTDRTVVLESIYEQSAVYMLNTSVSTYTVRFDLQDPTGLYDKSDTVLFVERDLERNGSVEWRVIVGDTFGVQGTPVTLAQEERYRIRIRNLETGTTATIGAYTAIQSETVTLTPGTATIEVIDSERNYGWSAVENQSKESLVFEYFDDEDQTDSLTLTIHERFNDSNVLVDNTTFSSANSIVFEQPLTANESNKMWMAEIYVDRGGTVYHYREPFTGQSGDLIPVSLDPVWRSAIGVFILLVTAMMFSQLNRSGGAVATALVGGMLWQIGLLSTVTIGPAIVFAIAIPVINHYRSGGGV